MGKINQNPLDKRVLPENVKCQEGLPAPCSPHCFIVPDGSKKTYVSNAWVAGNAFRSGDSVVPRPSAPNREQALALLPDPLWIGGDREIAAYRGVWEFALRNIRPATAANGFVSDYADTAFNNFTFLWDSAFITMFWRYGRAAWDAMGTLDNFYAKQHPDGFISRQISGADGSDHFPRHDPSSTGPNVLAWAEWESFRQTGDTSRLARVFPALAGYTRWMRRNRTWPDGSYWATGWASGMDDQPRRTDAFLEASPPQGDGFHVNFDHGHMAWVEACFQALLANRLLVRMAGVLGIGRAADEFRDEAETLASWCQANLWDEGTGFFHDRMRDGRLANHIKSVGAYWALLAEGVEARRMPRFLAHLSDPSAFARPHRVPSMSADSRGYEMDGGYWRGAVWAPTTYMVLRGLSAVGEDALAHEIALNHLQNVAASFAATGTFFENYAPESFANGRHRRDFVGWTGLSPTAILFEFVFGLRPDAAARTLVWDVRLTDEHGVRRYPFGPSGTLDLLCRARRSVESEPQVEISSPTPIEIEIRWTGGKKIVAAR